MPVPFDPSAPIPGEGGTTTPTKPGANYLPDGSYDIYNLGSLANGTDSHGHVVWPSLLLGQTGDDNGPRGPHGIPTETFQNVTGNPLEYMQQFAGWSVTNPSAYAALQSQLYEAGFYGSTKPKLGVWGAHDAAAMKAAMVGYLQVANPNNPQPLTLNDYLDHAAKQGAADTKASSDASAAAAKPSEQLTDPSTLRATLQSASQSALGRNLSGDELDKFVQQFQSREKSAFATAQTPGGVYSTPDPGAEANQFILQNNGPEYQGQQATDYVDAFLNMMLGGTHSAPPSPTPDPLVGGS